MVFDPSREYSIKDVANREVTYTEQVMSDVLTVISYNEEIPRDKIAEFIIKEQAEENLEIAILKFLMLRYIDCIEKDQTKKFNFDDLLCVLTDLKLSDAKLAGKYITTDNTKAKYYEGSCNAYYKIIKVIEDMTK